MTSTVLGRRGYVIRKECLEKDDLQQIREDLTFCNGDEFSSFGAPATKFPIYAENATKIYIPRYYGLEHYGDPEEVKFTESNPDPLLIVDKPFTFIGSLRDYQEEAIKKLFTHFNTIGSGGIICMPCGFGKTRTTIYSIYKLKNMFVKKKKQFKAIIVVHKEFLGNQWRQNISELIPEAKIGTIQANTVDIDGKDIVIAMLQSISMKEYPDSMFSCFDFAIFDECHHLAAMVFSKALLKIGCKYLLGLSATPNRSDGCHDIFHMSIGPIVYKIDRKVDDKVLIHKIVINSNSEHYKETFNKFTGNKQLPNMINDLCLFYDRNELIVNIMRQILKFEDGRKILLLSSRRDDKHLGFIKEILDANPITKKNGKLATYGYYMGRQGESKEKYTANLEISEKSDIILATLDISKEALDIKCLNTLIYATPIKGLEVKKVRNKVIECQTTIEQSIGRIQREPPESRKLIPLVIDIVDNFSNFVKWCYTRNMFYKKAGYPMTRNVITLNVDKHKKQKYNLDFLNNYEMFYADPAKIKEVTEGIERDDSSLSDPSMGNCCLIED